MQHAVVVAVRLIRFQAGELRVVLEVHTFVAEVAAHLEHALHAADAQPFEVQLGSDPQIQIEVVGIDVCAERRRVRAAVDLLKDRRLHLEVVAAGEVVAHRLHDGAVHSHQFARSRVDRQVNVPLTHSRLGVGEPTPLVRQRVQTLAEHPPVLGQQRQLALAAAPHHTADLDEVAEVDGACQVKGFRLERARIHEYLHVPAPVAHIAEHDLAEVTHADDAACHPGGGPFRRAHGLRDGVSGRIGRRIGVDAGRGQLLQFGQTDADLLGTPRSAMLGLFFAGDLRGDRVDVDTGRHRRGIAGEVVALPELRQFYKAFVDHGGQAYSRDRAAVLETQEPGNPLGVVLGVRLVQRFHLHELRREGESAVHRAHDRAGTDLAAFFEDHAEGCEVHRDVEDAKGLGVLGELGHHRLDQPVDRIPVATHHIERCAGLTPGDKREHADDLLVRGARVPHCLHEDGPTVRGVTQTPQSHREAAFFVGVTPFVGARDHRGHLFGRQILVTGDAHGDACALGAGHRLPDGLHLRSVEVVTAGVDDRLVADVQCGEPGSVPRFRARGAHADRARMPAVPVADREELRDRVGPIALVAHGVSAGHRRADLHPVGDCGHAVGSEDNCLVVAGGEIRQ